MLYSPNAVGLIEAFHPGTGKTLWAQSRSQATGRPGFAAPARAAWRWADGSDRRFWES